MPKQIPSSQKEENTYTRKQLRKREQKIQERLQKAQEVQSKAHERLERAKVQAQKKDERVKRLQGLLSTVQQQLNPHAPVIIPPGENDAHKEQLTEDRLLHPIPSQEALEPVRRARAVFEATEEAARTTVERALTLSSRMEQVETERHPEQEPLEPQTEKANATAYKAGQPVPVAEQEAGISNGKPETTLHTEMQNGLSSTGPENEVQAVHAAKGGEHLEEIEEEEEYLESAAAMAVAEAAAAAALTAQAEAEKRCTQTRRARRQVQRAEAAAAQIRTAIRNSSLSGSEAESALQAAIQRAAQARTVLAEAEAAEEQALKVALDAEAEAEVAEGMARSADMHKEQMERLRARGHSTAQEKA
jgi:hypothetical protein